MLFPLLILLLSSLAVRCGSLEGDHVCAKIEKYSVPITVTVAKPYTVRENYWCAKVPPRCTREKTQYKTELETEYVTKSRVISECCKGYFQESNTCVAYCAQGCGTKGECIAPGICKCHQDFYGPSCDKIYELVTLSSTSTTSATSGDILSSPPSATPAPAATSPATLALSTTTTTTSPLAITEEATSATTSSTIAEIALIQAITPSSSTLLYSPHADDEEAHSFDLEGQPSEVVQETVAAPSTSPSPPSTSPSTFVDTTPSTSVSFSSENTPSSAAPDDAAAVNAPSTSPSPSSAASSDFDFYHPHQQTPTFGPREFSSVIVLNNHTIHSISSLPHPNHVHSSFFEDHLTLIVIIGAALSLILGTALTVLACQQLVRNSKKKKVTPRDSIMHVRPPLPTAISLEMPHTPVSFSMGCDAIDLQPALYSMGTFKPADRQPTISEDLRRVLEATYDHPPSQSIRSCRSSEGQRSLAEMWEEVMSAAASNKAAEQAEQEQQLQSQLQEEEHLYQEIPCYHPRVEVHDSRC